MRFKKRQSLVVDISGVKIGGGNPVVIQSMTSGMRSDNSDPKKIAQDESKEAILLAKAGSQLIRIALDSKNAAAAIPYIRQNLDQAGFENVPLVGCGQYEVKQILTEYPDCVKHLGKLRINPGNIGFGSKRDKNFDEVIEVVCKHNIPIRIGVNWGSLDQALLQNLMDKNAKSKNPLSDKSVLQDALVNSALSSAERAKNIGLAANKIVISCKVSNFCDLFAVYKRLAQESDHALHLGLTEAGMGVEGIIKTSTALGALLSMGIGDTIRASLTQEPGQLRSTEVEVCKMILQSLGIKSFAPQITSCPGCGRTSSTYFRVLASQIKKYVANNLEIWKQKYKDIENFNIAVMGCVVNGPGESKHADIGISLPGHNEKKVAAVFVKGKLFKKLAGDEILQEFKEIIDQYIKDNYQLI
jgi:(E)-4-hydroxy-3-methylbut-2-enyl-diphosphate synthase